MRKKTDTTGAILGILTGLALTGLILYALCTHKPKTNTYNPQDTTAVEYSGRLQPP